MNLRERFILEWKTWRMLAGVRAWAMDSYSRVLLRVDPFGHRGQIACLRLRGKAQPYALRLASGDRSILFETNGIDEYRMACESSRRARTILDLGANVGYSVRLWLDFCPHAKIVAVEPDGANLEIAKRNIELSGQAGRVELLHGAAAAQPGVLYYSSGETGAGIILSAQRKSPNDVEVTSWSVPQLLDRLCPAGQMLDLLKCDIEGGEGPVFGDCRSWIRRCRAIMVETHEPYSLDALMADIARNHGSYRMLYEHKRPGFAVGFILNEAAGADTRVEQLTANED